MDEIVANFENILVFLKTVAVKEPRFTTIRLSLRADKLVQAWFCHWSAHHLSPLHPYHSRAIVSLRTHQSPEQRCYTTSERRSPPPWHCSAVQGG